MRLALVCLLVLSAVAASLATLSSPADAPAPAPTPFVFHTAMPVASGAPTEAPRHSPLGLFSVPVEGAELPTDPALLPESARDYRAGFHEGIDFPADAGTPVLAAAAGTVIRVDAVFEEWTAEQRTAAFEAARALGYTPEATLDRTRGRQVWLDHGRGLVTRYAHLESVAPLVIGEHVAAGTRIGAVGSSGYPEGGPHLHLEIRLGASYLGDGLPPEQLARVNRRAFR